MTVPTAECKFAGTHAGLHRRLDAFDYANYTHGELSYAGHGEVYTVESYEHVHEYVAICFLMVGMFCGNGIQIILEAVGNPIPYTVAVFVFGILLSLVHDTSDHGLGVLRCGSLMSLSVPLFN
jgi:hypothetical protein